MGLHDHRVSQSLILGEIFTDCFVVLVGLVDPLHFCCKFLIFQIDPVSVFALEMLLRVEAVLTRVLVFFDYSLQLKYFGVDFIKSCLWLMIERRDVLTRLAVVPIFWLFGFLGEVQWLGLYKQSRNRWLRCGRRG